MHDIKLSHVTIEDCTYQSCGGYTVNGTFSQLVGYIPRGDDPNHWRCTRMIHGPDHWATAVERAADSAAKRYGVEVIDLRDCE